MKPTSPPTTAAPYHKFHPWRVGSSGGELTGKSGLFVPPAASGESQSHIIERSILMEPGMLGLISYFLFLGTLGLIMRVALGGRPDRARANAAAATAAMLSARLH